MSSSPQEPLFKKEPEMHPEQVPMVPDVQVEQLTGQSTHAVSMPTVRVGHVFTG